MVVAGVAAVGFGSEVAPRLLRADFGFGRRRGWVGKERRSGKTSLGPAGVPYGPPPPPRQLFETVVPEVVQKCATKYK